MNRPIQPGLLEGNDVAREYKKQYASYKKELLAVLSAESGLSDPHDLVVYLTELYHPRLRIKQKVGARTRWSDYLNCAVAVEVDFLRVELSTRKSAIESLVDTLPWEKLVTNSKDPFGLFDKADKAGRKSKFYQILKQARLYSIKINDLPSYQKTVNSLVADALKKN